MNIAVIFAGGTGQRMNSRTVPKQFLELHGKPILAWTIEKFQKHPSIDKIILVVLEDWIDYCIEMKDLYKFNKLRFCSACNNIGKRRFPCAWRAKKDATS